MAHKQNGKIPAKRVNWQEDTPAQILRNVERHEILGLVLPSKPVEPWSTDYGYVRLEASKHAALTSWDQLAPMLPVGLSLQGFKHELSRVLEVSIDQLGNGVFLFQKASFRLLTQWDDNRYDTIRPSGKFRGKDWVTNVSIQGQIRRLINGVEQAQPVTWYGKVSYK